MRFFRYLLLPLLPLALASCLGGGGAAMGGLNLNLDLGLSAQDGITERTTEGGVAEMILEPLDVWDDKGAGSPEQMSVQGEKMFFRLRETESFDRAWVRLGLYWNARQKRVHMPIVVVGGPPVRVQKVRIDADNHTDLLQPSRNFQFTPTERLFDKADELHTGAFSLSPETLARIAAAENAYVTITTDRGGLRVNLSVITNTSASALTASGKYQFAQFYRRMQAGR